MCVCVGAHMGWHRVCVRVPPGIRFMKAYAWITSERLPQVANLMSPLYLLPRSLLPSSLPSPPPKKVPALKLAHSLLKRSHDGQERVICALLRGRVLAKLWKLAMDKKSSVPIRKIATFKFSHTFNYFFLVFKF